MASEIRVNKITHTAGVGTITSNADGIVVAGIVTANSFSGINSVTATSFHGSGTNITGRAEVYGFTGIGSDLQVTTTNAGADNITGAQYDAFEQVLFAPSGITFSINSSGNLIATI